MGPSRVIWQEKVRIRIGWPKKGVVARLARAIREPSRTVYGWLWKDRSPHNESAILAKIARALRVPLSWLTDGQAGDPPHVPESVSAEWIQVVDRAQLPPRIRQLAYALGDREASEWLADAYERLYLPTRRSRAGS